MLQVKADVETQGEFVESLANEVRAASFVNIDDVVAFVNWLDEELSFLVSSPNMPFIPLLQSTSYCTYDTCSNTKEDQQHFRLMSEQC